MSIPRALCLLAALALARPAAAALAVPASVEDLARASDAVVRGKVARVTARWTADQKRIFTFAEVETAAVWRGSAAARVSVAVPGGEVGGIGQRVDGAPRFGEGEEVVLFLGKAEAGHYRVRGLAQGKFTVVAGQATPDLAHTELVPGAALKAGERRAEGMAVDELERRVRAAR